MDVTMSHNWFTVLVTGITGGGKSELCTYLYKKLPASTRMLRQDNYFLPADSPEHVKVKCLDNVEHCNWDVIGCLDMDSMWKDVKAIIDNPPGQRDERQEMTYINMVDEDFSKKIEAWDEDQSSACDGLEVGNKVALSSGLKDSSTMRPILIMDGFTLLDEARFTELADQVFFFELNKAECIRRRQLRSYDPPDIPGYFDNCVYPMYEEYLKRCVQNYSTKIQQNRICFLDGAADQQEILRSALSIVRSAAITLM